MMLDLARGRVPERQHAPLNGCGTLLTVAGEGPDHILLGSSANDLSKSHAYCEKTTTNVHFLYLFVFCNCFVY